MGYESLLRSVGPAHELAPLCCPQPALLYIVPVVCGACVVFAAARGELRQLWSFKVQGGFMPLALADL